MRQIAFEIALKARFGQLENPFGTATFSNPRSDTPLGGFMYQCKKEEDIVRLSLDKSQVLGVNSF